MPNGGLFKRRSLSILHTIRSPCVAGRKERSPKMETVYDGMVSVPTYQIMSLLVIMTVALLFGYVKMGLFLCYAFVFYWGNIFNVRAVLGSVDPDSSSVSFLFIGFGLIIVFLAMLGFLLNKD